MGNKIEELDFKAMEEEVERNSELILDAVIDCLKSNKMDSNAMKGCAATSSAIAKILAFNMSLLKEEGAGIYLDEVVEMAKDKYKMILHNKKN